MYFPLLALLVSAVLGRSSRKDYVPFPPLKEQAAIVEEWKLERWAYVPKLLEKYDVDAWIVSQREYAEDTAFQSLSNPITTFAARRRTLLLFHTSSALPSPIYHISNKPEELFDEVRKELEIINPSKIALDKHHTLAFGDGLHVGELDMLRDGLGEEWWSRAVWEPNVAIEYAARRVDGMKPVYRHLMHNIWEIIDEAFSNDIIVPGKTNTDEIVWWLREKYLDLVMTTWFHPSVSVWRQGFTSWQDDVVIQEGDMLHTDMGIWGFSLATDTQHLVHVLRPNETSVPSSLLAGLSRANDLQDLVLETMSTDLTGNEVLQIVRNKMEERDWRGSIYCHPIGDRGHFAGSLIGMTNLQDGVPHLGDLKIFQNSWYSIELSSTVYVPEWGVDVTFPTEEDVMWNSEKSKWEWAQGRQEKFHLVDSNRNEGVTGQLLIQG
ncbi:xaa-Pro aminopeptidase family enzyme [Atractiella rhizophila]|nr:xaa-Pro aminopeptidase family enzyme [Atractiella rhizophila]